MKNQSNKYGVLGNLVIPAVYCWVYPHPGNVKRKIAELEKIHNERVAHIEEEIETAKRHQGGTRVYGGAEPWAQAERDELALQDKLSQENIDYNKKIDELNKFPLTKALVLFGIFLTSDFPLRTKDFCQINKSALL